MTASGSERFGRRIAASLSGTLPPSDTVRCAEVPAKPKLGWIPQSTGFARGTLTGTVPMIHPKRQPTGDVRRPASHGDVRGPCAIGSSAAKRLPTLHTCPPRTQTVRSVRPPLRRSKPHPLPFRSHVTYPRRSSPTSQAFRRAWVSTLPIRSSRHPDCTKLSLRNDCVRPHDAHPHSVRDSGRRPGSEAGACDPSGDGLRSQRGTERDRSRITASKVCASCPAPAPRMPRRPRPSRWWCATDECPPRVSSVDRELSSPTFPSLPLDAETDDSAPYKAEVVGSSWLPFRCG